MGSLRTLLAITVIFAHSYGYVFVGGRNAVQLFYMFSGFLISHVIVEQKAYSSVVLFYISRYLRILPAYLAVAALTIITLLIDRIYLNREVELFRVYQSAPFEANAALVVSNIFLLSQDWIFFMGVDGDELIFTTNFTKSDVVLWQGLVVPQAWTLGIELSFYLIAPFILTKRKVLFVLLFLSGLLRIYLIWVGLGRQDPWSYRFFPTELAFFLLGAISHQSLLPLYRKTFSNDSIERCAAIATYSLILITAIFWLIPINEIIKSATLFALFFFLMPFVFLFQSKRRWDKEVGDISYPIYVCHILVIHLVDSSLGVFGIDNNLATSLAAVAFSACVALALNIYLERPVERFRKKIRKAE